MLPKLFALGSWCDIYGIDMYVSLQLTNTHTDVCHTVTATQARATDQVFLSCKPILILFEGNFNL